VSSVDALSDTSTTKSVKLWPRTLSSASVIMSARFHVGITTVSAGPDGDVVGITVG